VLVQFVQGLSRTVAAQMVRVLPSALSISKQRIRCGR
jgi:hypothetical protein